MRGYECERCGAALDPGERCDCTPRSVEWMEIALASKNMQALASARHAAVERMDELARMADMSKIGEAFRLMDLIDEADRRLQNTAAG